jgi:hypothetical protein
MPRILYLHSNAEDYLGDALLHGLRVELGNDVVDVPRRDALYADLSEDRRARLYGRGFTLYGRLPEADVWRGWPYERALQGEFDLVVFGDVWRHWGSWLQLRPHLRELRRNGVTLVALDGGDGAVMYPYGPSFWRRMRPWPLPRIHGRALYFKREMSPVTAWLRWFGVVPPPIAARLLRRSVRPLGFAIPEDHLATGLEPKTKLLAKHCVDPEVAAHRDELQTTHAFADEAAYFADLRAARFGITTKRAGWDCLRHYELAASGCVPCFRDLDAKPALSTPHGLDETNCVPYNNAEALLAELGSMSEQRYARLRAAALVWAARNTTRARAIEFLRAVDSRSTF